MHSQSADVKPTLRRSVAHALCVERRSKIRQDGLMGADPPDMVPPARRGALGFLGNARQTLTSTMLSGDKAWYCFKGSSSRAPVLVVTSGRGGCRR